MLFIFVVLIGIVAGLRTLTPIAAVSWAAYLGWIDLNGTPLAFFGFRWAPWIATVLAIVEYITDQLPSTPSRTVPVQFGARIISGGLCGAAIGVTQNALVLGALLGIVGAVIGTLGGRAARGALAAQFKSDRPAAFLEDAVAILLAFLIVSSV